MVRIARTGTQMAAGHITALGGWCPTCVCPTKNAQTEPVIGNVCIAAIGCRPCYLGHCSPSLRGTSPLHGGDP